MSVPLVFSCNSNNSEGFTIIPSSLFLKHILPTDFNDIFYATTLHCHLPGLYFTVDEPVRKIHFCILSFIFKAKNRIRDSFDCYPAFIIRCLPTSNKKVFASTLEC